MPRPSKGDRAKFTLRLPIGLVAIMEATLEEEKTAFVERAIREKLKRDHGIG